MLTWNLFHGRAVPPAGVPLLGAFADALAGWDWDVALLQEVPPWWPPALARASGATAARAALTSRNAGLAVRRAVAVRAPDAIKSNGGGANAILVRDDQVLEHRRETLRWWPERRVVHGLRLASGAWVVNLHAAAHVEARAASDIAQAGRAALRWSGGGPVVLGGDLNHRSPRIDGFAMAGGRTIDFVFVHELQGVGPARVLEAGRLSDHAPVVVQVG